MKESYERYGRRTAELEQSLTEKDREILTSFLHYCAMTAGQNRLQRYRTIVLQFRDIIEKPLDSITKEDAVRFWGILRTAPFEEHTRITIRKVVKRFLKWYYRDFEMIEELKVPSNYLVNKERVNKSTLLRSDEIQLMLHRAERLRDKALLVLLYETAARPQEIRDLKWSAIDWNESEVHLYSRKTQDDRDLPLKEAIKHLKRWHDEWVFPDPRDDDYIFPSTVGSRYNREKPVSVTYINRIIKQLATKAGITRNVNSYLLRHTRLTEIRKLGIQGVEFRKFAGHTSARQEAVYVHLDNEDMKQSVLEKVYKIKEEQGISKEYENRIALLEETLRVVIGQLQEMRASMERIAVQQIS